MGHPLVIGHAVCVGGWVGCVSGCYVNIEISFQECDYWRSVTIPFFCVPLSDNILVAQS